MNGLNEVLKTLAANPKLTEDIGGIIIGVVLVIFFGVVIWRVPR